MNRLTSDKFFAALFLLFIAATATGVVLFALGMRDSTYVINDGAGYVTQYLNRPKYESHLEGFVFAFTFLIAGLLMAAVILLPGGGGATQPQALGPPQPRQRQPRALPAATPALQAAAAAPAAAAPAVAAPATAQAAPAVMVAAAEAPAPAEAPASPKPAQPVRSVEEEVLAQNPDDLPKLEREDARFEDTGEDDVVYGTGRVTDDSLWDFILRHPDSAVKFLYRKTLDNKALSTAEEDIYRRWEQRGMTRSKIRALVLEIMSWKSLPEDFPHNIWRELRDQVFDLRNR
jgi:hypothetical protein